MIDKMRRVFRPLARAGYAARGLIYGVIGVFAALAAIGSGEAMGSKDALQLLLSSGAGSALSYALIAGLAFYALWRLIQAGFDTDNHGWGAKGMAIRGGLLVSGVAYAMLASYCWSLAIGSGGGSGGRGWAGTLAGFVGTRWVSAGLALALAGAGVAHLIKAVRSRYARYLKADPQTMRVIHPIAKTGLIARGVVFLVLTFLLVTRSIRGGDQASSDAALEFIQSLPIGWLLLTLIGLGLIAFALYSFTEAIYRRVNVEDASV